MEEYIQFGKEWEKEMKKLPKDTLILLLKQACLDRLKAIEKNVLINATKETT